MCALRAGALRAPAGQHAPRLPLHPPGPLQARPPRAQQLHRHLWHPQARPGFTLDHEVAGIPGALQGVVMVMMCRLLPSKSPGPPCVQVWLPGPDDQRLRHPLACPQATPESCTLSLKRVPMVARMASCVLCTGAAMSQACMPLLHLHDANARCACSASLAPAQPAFFPGASVRPSMPQADVPRGILRHLLQASPVLQLQASESSCSGTGLCTLHRHPSSPCSASRPVSIPSSHGVNLYSCTAGCPPGRTPCTWVQGRCSAGACCRAWMMLASSAACTASTPQVRARLGLEAGV